MARERIQLVPDEILNKEALKQQLLTGEMTPEIFSTLLQPEKDQINEILFDIASEKVIPNVALSVLEFALFSFMRVMTKKMNNVSLTAEDQEIMRGLEDIMAVHEITDGVTPKANWQFDYLAYAQYNAQKFLENRKEHVERKKQTIGEV